MDPIELLNSFTSLLDTYSKHRTYIERAVASPEKFSEAVVEKVELDHEIKFS